VLVYALSQREEEEEESLQQEPTASAGRYPKGGAHHY
jgi:hypothetical protein